MDESTNRRHGGRGRTGDTERNKPGKTREKSLREEKLEKDTEIVIPQFGHYVNLASMLGALTGGLPPT